MSEHIIGWINQGHYGKGLLGDVFDRPEPEQVVKEREHRQGKRLPGGKVEKQRRGKHCC